MRRVLTILAPVVALTTLVVFSVLYLQYRVRIRGHSLGLPHPNLAPRPSNILGVNIHLFSDSSETINNTFDKLGSALTKLNASFPRNLSDTTLFQASIFVYSSPTFFSDWIWGSII